MKIELDGLNWKFKTETPEEDDFYDSYWSNLRQGETDEFVYYYGCCNCNITLDEIYSVMMAQLQRANLLPEDFKHYCCICYLLKKVGLLDLRDYFDHWHSLEDILYLDFLIPVIYNGFVHHESFEFRIHDYKKVLL